MTFVSKRSVCVALVAVAPMVFAHEDDVPTVLRKMEFGYVGRVDFPISCESENSQKTFNLALALYSHMTYGYARVEFQKILEQEPECAMAHWGVAMTLTHPVWPGTPDENALRSGSAAVAKARKYSAKVTDRERLYIEAVAALYDDWQNVPYKARIERWYEAQHKVYESYPNDDEAATLYALSLVAVGDSNADANFEKHIEAGAILDGLFLRNPEHPGVIHYTIHAFDKPALAEKAVSMARAYGKIAPNLPHALHMPTHIFTRLGMWGDSKVWNERARQATLPMRTDGRIPTHEYVHVSDYLMYAHIQTGHEAEAEALITDIEENGPHLNTLATAYAFAAIPARYALELRLWDRAAALEPRWDGNDPEMTWDNYSPCEAVTYFARGVGGALGGQPKVAQQALNALEGLRVTTLQSQIPFWEKRVRIQKRAVEACIAYAEGKHDRALNSLKNIANMEDDVGKHPVMPAVVLPIRELYADLLMEQKRYAAALAAYKINLDSRPGRFNSIGGAGRAAELLGRDADARAYYELLLELTEGADSIRPELGYAQKFLRNASPD